MGAEWPTEKTYIGITDDDRTPVENFSGMPKHRAIRRFKPHVDTPIFDSTAKTYAGQGRLPVISFKPVVNGVAKSHQQVTAGALNSQLDQLKDDLQSDGSNIVVCYCPEPESADEAARFGGGIDRYKVGPYFADAFRYCINRVGAQPNIRWAWCLTGYWMDELAFKRTDWVSAFNPGRKVWYACSDPYNWCSGSGHGTPRSFPTLISGLIRYAHDFDKEVGIMEFATFKDPKRPRWIDTVGPELAKHNRLKFACYFNNNTTSAGECDWRLEVESAGVVGNPSLVAWKNLLAGVDVDSIA